MILVFLMISLILFLFASYMLLLSNYVHQLMKAMFLSLLLLEDQRQGEIMTHSICSLFPLNYAGSIFISQISVMFYNSPANAYTHASFACFDSLLCAPYVCKGDGINIFFLLLVA